MPPVLGACWAGVATPRRSHAGWHGVRAELGAPSAAGLGVAPPACSSKCRSESGNECSGAPGRRMSMRAAGDAAADNAAEDTLRHCEGSSTDQPQLPLRRRHLALSGALLPALCAASNAEVAGAAEPGSPSTTAASPEGQAPSRPTAAPGAPRRPASQVVDLSQWQLVVGEGFVLQVPPGWQDLTPRVEEDEAAQSTLRMQNRAQKSPFVARYASPDGAEVISVVLQQASKVKLTFLEIDDVSALGSIGEAARLFMSPEARVLGSREFQAAWIGKRPRTYYLYEYVSAGQHVAMSVSASAGYLFVVGASAPEDKWRPAAARLRAAAGAFQLTV